ncbi:MAG TPA: hypothetical protein VJ725_14505 [Thermoanaerobaculia bacterium]|nr:hypothetical protein [Thermoanaerobaculia bacterium]
MLYYSIALFIGGIMMHVKGNETYIAASMAYDDDEKRALLRAGKRRRAIGWALILISVMLIPGFILFISSN